MHHFFLSFQQYFEVGGDEGLHEEKGTQDGSLLNTKYWHFSSILYNSLI
jgi:hypothetical protein